jgi:hypothetical protein
MESRIPENDNRWHYQRALPSPKPPITVSTTKGAAMPRKNSELRDRVQNWMIQTMKQSPVEKTTLARLAAAQFRMDYEPRWMDKMAEEIALDHTEPA